MWVEGWLWYSNLTYGLLWRLILDHRFRWRYLGASDTWGDLGLLRYLRETCCSSFWRSLELLLRWYWSRLLMLRLLLWNRRWLRELLLGQRRLLMWELLLWYLGRLLLWYRRGLLMCLGSHFIPENILRRLWMSSYNLRLPQGLAHSPIKLCLTANYSFLL